MDELAEVRADDALINDLAAGAPGTDWLTKLLAAWVAAVAAGPPPIERMWDGCQVRAIRR